MPAMGFDLHLTETQRAKYTSEPFRYINQPKSLNLNPKGEQLKTYSANQGLKNVHKEERGSHNTV